MSQILVTHSRDTGKTCLETLYSTDSSLLGIRGLYNFGPLASSSSSSSSSPQVPSSNSSSRLSLGSELYYGLSNNSFGISHGLRFHDPTLPSTSTLTLAPLTGTISATYSVAAGEHLALASRLVFNVYSWESDVVLGCELWRTRTRPRPYHDAGKNTTKSENESDREEEEGTGTVQGVLKARVDQSGKLSVAWEGRIKALLFSLGES